MTVPFSQDRLIRKEEMLGIIRERQFPEGHIGLSSFAPFKAVATDDVIFEYVQPTAGGLAPARSQDAESELAAKEDTFGLGNASVVDWAIKDHYQPGDVNAYQEAAFLRGALEGVAPLPTNVTLIGNTINDFEARVARDAALRRTKIDSRLEWCIMQALWAGAIVYDDGKIVFTADYGRPAGQNGATNPGTGASITPWDTTAADPLGDIYATQLYMKDTYGVDMNRIVMSQHVMRNIMVSNRFAARASGLAIAGSATASSTPVDPRYFGFDPRAALAIFESATGLSATLYDSVYWTRTLGSTTRSIHRFSPADKVLLLPSQDSISALDDAIGFGATLTSPHPEGNWTSGYYEWQKDTGPDPWGYDAGTGIKAFPVFPHLDLSVVLTVLSSAGAIPGR